LIGCLALVLLLALLIVAVPTLLGTGLLDNLVRSIGNLANPPTIARSTSTQTILMGIQPLGQLVTVSAQLAKADIHIGVQQGGLNACGFSASHVAQGAIEAGINLANIREEDIRYDALNDRYTLTLPAPELTSCRIDFIRQYERSTTICNVDWDEANQLARFTALNEFRTDAIEGGVLDRAEVEARLVLGNFISAVTGSSAEIVFQEAAVTAVPSSCAPEPPASWVYDETTRAWINVP
jgi:hypothetical protein